MNIQINTQDKTIKLQETVNLGELAEVLNKLFPANEWKNWKLETNTIINNWANPWVISRWDHNPYPWWSPSYGGYVITNDAVIGQANGSSDFNVNAIADGTDFEISNTITGNSGVYNVTVNV